LSSFKTHNPEIEIDLFMDSSLWITDNSYLQKTSIILLTIGQKNIFNDFPILNSAHMLPRIPIYLI
jgi:hypothetical protein